MRLLYGLENVPRTLAADDPCLPSVQLGPEPLRLNTIPLPREAWGADPASHAGRYAAVEAWLLAQCGDYNAVLRRAVTRLLAMMAVGEIAGDFAQFDGLFQPHDRFWSAPRPLPRVWVQQDGVWQRLDLAIWDGVALHALDIRNLDLPPICRDFWHEMGLPMSPFRR